MCSHYEGVRNREKFLKHFRAEPPADMGKLDVWPGYEACFIRRHEHADVGDDAVPEREVQLGRYGLIAPWVKELKVVRNTYNARVETVATKPTFRSAWRRAQHCIVPADAFYEPDYRLNPTRSVPAKIGRADGSPMGIAGLWESWTAPDGRKILSITMLTINADDHPLMKNFHKPSDEKRMVVILPEERYGAWLSASAEESLDFCTQYPAEKMVATSEVSTGSLL